MAKLQIQKRRSQGERRAALPGIAAKCRKKDELHFPEYMSGEKKGSV